MVYYNEIDGFNAQWLRELIKEGVIAEGVVDERDIKNLRPSDLDGYTQCHFFAGIGIWSYALKQAGWEDARPCWTGSCPCQPFSLAGKRGKASDGRHLWPVWFDLIRESEPVTLFGEQVASDDGLAWLDVVCSDLEGQAYTCGTVDTCAAGFGAPQIRQRLYFVADSSRDESVRRNRLRLTDGKDASKAEESERTEADRFRSFDDATDGSTGVGQADAFSQQSRRTQDERRMRESERSSSIGVAQGDTNSTRLAVQPFAREERQDGQLDTPSLTNGFWRDAEWIYCKDDKYRCVEPGSFPLASRSANHVGLLRGYGNSLCAPQAEAFVRTYLQELQAR